MLEAARDAGASRFFFASSVVVYNTKQQHDPSRPPLTEPDAYPAFPDDGYGWEKLFGERMCRHFREDFGLATRVARFQPVYGPHQSWDDGRERATLALCRKVALAVLTGNPTIEIWGDGTQQRSLMWIDDCVKGIQELTASDRLDPINLGPSRIVTVNELVSTIERVAGVTLARTYRTDLPQGAPMRRISNQAWRDTFGWEPSTDLLEGLEKTYRWVYDQVVAKHGPAQKPSRAVSPPAPARQATSKASRKPAPRAKKKPAPSARAPRAKNR
jgi:nucleoside-diphosphate-sugar epimerase